MSESRESLKTNLKLFMFYWLRYLWPIFILYVWMFGYGFVYVFGFVVDKYSVNTLFNPWVS